MANYTHTTWENRVEGVTDGTLLNADNLNNIEDCIESQRKIPTAAGTGTVITVTSYQFDMSDGAILSFVASADNSGAATTLNVNSLGAKSVYKPGGTDAPTILDGRAYTVWYDLSGDCFFVKAGVEVAGGTTMNFLACSAGSGDTKSTTETSYAKRMSCVVGVDGIYRVAFNLYSTGYAAAYGRIYKNGVAFGTERSTTSASPGVQYSEDLQFSAGDSIEIYTRVSTVTQNAIVGEFLIKNSTNLFYYTKY